MKKKTVSLCLVLALLVTAAIGGTMAYFTDTDNETNTFTVGNVKIDLWEEFEQKDAQDITPGKKVNKDVYVTNEGTNPAFVRVHLAVPTALDDGDPSFNASQNFVHWNFSRESVAAGLWSWIPEYTEGTGYLGNGPGNWNFYQTTIDKKEYNVYVATYRTALPAGETTKDVITQVYLDATVDCTVNEEDGTVTYKDTKDHEVTMGIEETFDIKVFAEAVQSEGFSDAYAAFAASYPAIGSYNPWDVE